MEQPKTPSNSLDENEGKDNNLTGLNPQFDYEKIGIGAIKTEAEKLIQQGNEAGETKGLFLVKTAARWIEGAKNRPIP